MNAGDGGLQDEVCFQRNTGGWVLISQRLGSGKVIVTSTKKPKIPKQRKGNKGNQHREYVLELEGSVKIKPKLVVDISKFTRPLQ